MHDRVYHIPLPPFPHLVLDAPAVGQAPFAVLGVFMYFHSGVDDESFLIRSINHIPLPRVRDAVCMIHRDIDK